MTRALPQAAESTAAWNLTQVVDLRSAWEWA